MGLWLMIVGAVGAGVMARPSLGAIAPSASLQAPSSASAARLVSVSSEAPAMVLHPGAAERGMAMLASRPEETIYGDFHNYAVRSLDVESLDGVALGSAWQVVSDGAAVRCTVTGFAHIAPIDATITDIGAPCGGPLVQAVLACDGVLVQEGIALPTGVSVSVAAAGADTYIDDIRDPALATLAATPLFQGHERALSAEGAVEVSFSSRAIVLDGAEMTLLSGVLYAGNSAVALSGVVQGSDARFVREGGSSVVLDIGRDGTLDVLGWQTPAGTAGVTWTLQGADTLWVQETINWCQTGC